MSRVQEMTARRTDAAMVLVLTLDRVTLALPQHEIAALEPVLDVQARSDGKSNAAATLMIAGRSCPVYALGSELNCLPKIPDHYRVCAVLHGDLRDRAESFALACADARLMPRAALTAHALPRLLTTQKTPVKSLFVVNGQLFLATNANALFAHVARVDAEIIPFAERARKARS